MLGGALETSRGKGEIMKTEVRPSNEGRTSIG